MVLDEADAIAFDHTVSTMAATIGTLGHPGDVDVRRAHAVGLLADPQAALDLLAGAAAGASPDSDSEAESEAESEVVCVAEDLAHERANPFRRPTGPASGGAGGGAGEVVLVFHVTDRDLLDDPHGVAHSPKLGPVLVGRLRSWLLTAGTVTIKPVVDLDPAAHPPVDRHDPPARMAAAVRYRDTTCVFPRCGRPAEALRPRPHRPLRPARRRRTARPDPHGEPRAPVPQAPPCQDVRRLHLPSPARRVLRVDAAHRHSGHDRPRSSRAPHHRHASPTNLTAPQPDTHPVIGPQARPSRRRTRADAWTRHVMCCDGE